MIEQSIDCIVVLLRDNAMSMADRFKTIDDAEWV